MAAGTDPSERIVIVDAGHGVGLALTSLLADRGFDVIALAPGDCHSSQPDTGLLGSAKAVIFNMSALDEAELLTSGELADAVATDAAHFLQNLQTVSRAMIEKGSGQIWVLGLDDSFAYYLPLAIAPITHQTRIGAVRALAKELSRFGVCANAAVIQPTLETVEASAWQEARTGVGSYAQKFKPVSLAHVADTLAFWLGCERLPMNGSVVHFGNGVYDGNT